MSCTHSLLDFWPLEMRNPSFHPHSMSTSVAISVSHRHRPAGEYGFGCFSSGIFSLIAYDARFAGKNTINWNKLPSAMTSTSVDERERQAIENFHIHEISADDDDNDVIYREKNRVFEIESTTFAHISLSRCSLPAPTQHPFCGFLEFTFW